MHCSKCNKDWDVSQSATSCPYCGAAVFSAKQEPEIQDAFVHVLDFFGLELFNNKTKLLNLLSDIAPKCANERNLLRNAFNIGVDQTMLAANDKSDQEKVTTLFQVRNDLKEKLFLDENGVDIVIICLFEGLHWDIKIFESTPVGGQRQTASGAQQGAGRAAVAPTLQPEKPAVAQTVLGEGKPMIKNKEFKKRGDLESVRIADGVTNIGMSAFSDCENLVSVAIPASVTRIGESAFYNCSELQTITVASGNTVYRSIGNCLIEIAESKLVCGCKKSAIPGAVTKIGDYAFSGCGGLTFMNIPESVTYIGRSAFEDCASLVSVGIPKSVVVIAKFAFCDCNVLKNVYYGGKKANWERIDIGGFNNALKKATVIFSD